MVIIRLMLQLVNVTKSELCILTPVKFLHNFKFGILKFSLSFP